jgi:hypothetical protein
MDIKNFSWGILTFGAGLILSILGILVLALMQVNDPVAYGTLAATANGCLVGISSVMNPNKKFDDTNAEIRDGVEELKAMQKQQRPPTMLR